MKVIIDETKIIDEMKIIALSSRISYHIIPILSCHLNFLDKVQLNEN